jgi:hypothetical protein
MIKHGTVGSLCIFRVIAISIDVQKNVEDIQIALIGDDDAR